MGLVNLLNLFETITLPSENESFEFCAVTIPKYSTHRLAKDRSGSPTLLIGAEDEIRTSTPSIKLQNLTVDFDVKCCVKEGDSSFEDSYCVLRFIGRSLPLQIYFFRLLSSLIENLGKRPTQSQVRDEIKQFVELLRLATEAPRNTIQGLWAELFLICQHPNPAILLSCWHANPGEKFDFNNGTERLEVKSCSGSSRLHTFSIEQLNPPLDVVAFVASVFVHTSPQGMSLRDLEDQIVQAIDNQSTLVKKLRLLIAQTLGNTLDDDGLRFDYQNALESLKFFRVEDVPRIVLSSVPTLVSQVKFQSNLDAAPPLQPASVFENCFK